VLVVPLEKDVIKTSDGQAYKVISYTNYKDGGPAVYAKAKDSKAQVLIYFFDIESINGTKVEFQRGSRVFRALGRIDRQFNLPQPDDKVVVMTSKMSDEDSKERVEVAALKLKSKALGVNKGLMFKDLDGNAYRLSSIVDIDRALGSESFDRQGFLNYYSEYTGV